MRRLVDDGDGCVDLASQGSYGPDQVAVMGHEQQRIAFIESLRSLERHALAEFRRIHAKRSHDLDPALAEAAVELPYQFRRIFVGERLAQVVLNHLSPVGCTHHGFDETNAAMQPSQRPATGGL